MEKEYILGEIKDNMLAIGKIIKWMEKEYSLGQMGENMKGKIRMIKKKDMVFLSGQMVKNIEVFGKMGNKMEKVNFIIMPLNSGKNALFKMVKKSNGWNNLMIY